MYAVPRVLSEAEHMLLRSPRDRVDCYTVGDVAGEDSAKRLANLLDENVNVDVCMQASGVNAVGGDKDLVLS